MRTDTKPGYLWLDLETSGLDPHSDDLLEIGAILTGADFEPADTFHRIVAYVNEPDTWDDEVRAIHNASGLTEQSKRSTISPGHALTELRAWVAAAGDAPLTLAGSGVAHFDRPWIKALAPSLDDRLNYWTLDVGVLRRTLRAAGIDTGWNSVSKAHRALDDVTDHLAEFRHITAMLQRAAGKDQP